MLMQNVKFDFKAKIELENDHVKLDPLEWKHFELMLPIALESPDLLQFSPSGFGTENLLEEYFHSALSQKQEGLRYPFAIYDKLKGCYAGSTSYGNISSRDLRLEIGWTWIRKGCQGTGLNRQCKFLLLGYVFDNLGFERVEFKTDSRNVQSRKAIEGIGGKFEGELRSHTLMPDGFRRNTVYYSILKSEWEIIQGSILKK